MTRINAFIPVEELSDKHLLAEHREIKRIPNMINSGKAKIENIPDQFTLGPGHVKFFYNKLLWLYNRYEQIYNRCIEKHFEVTSYHKCFMANDCNRHLLNDWQPSKKEIKRIQGLIRQRIIDNNNRPKKVKV